MTWLEIIERLGFPVASLVAIFWLVILPIRNRYIKHIDTVDRFIESVPKLLTGLSDGQKDMANAVMALSKAHDDNYPFVSNELTHTVLAHGLDAALEVLSGSPLNEAKASSARRHLHEAKNKLSHVRRQHQHT